MQTVLIVFYKYGWIGTNDISNLNVTSTVTGEWTIDHDGTPESFKKGFKLLSDETERSFFESVKQQYSDLDYKTDARGYWCNGMYATYHFFSIIRQWDDQVT